jgi:hypothetical protein
MARGKVGVYDDGRLVEMLAGGEFTYAQIGKALGLTAGHVGRIARGERRPGVMAEVRARVAAALAEARRVAVRSCRRLMARHVEVGLAGRGETARKCREFVLSRLELARPARQRAVPSRETPGPQSLGVGAAAEPVGWVERSEDPPACRTTDAQVGLRPSLPTGGAAPAPAAEAEVEAWMEELARSQGPRPRPDPRRKRHRKGHHPNFVPLGVR